jgi:hypothetical protein
MKNLLVYIIVNNSLTADKEDALIIKSNGIIKF